MSFPHAIGRCMLRYLPVFFVVLLLAAQTAWAQADSRCTLCTGATDDISCTGFQVCTWQGNAPEGTPKCTPNASRCGNAPSQGGYCCVPEVFGSVCAATDSDGVRYENYERCIDGAYDTNDYLECETDSDCADYEGQTCVSGKCNYPGLHYTEKGSTPEVDVLQKEACDTECNARAPFLYCNNRARVADGLEAPSCTTDPIPGEVGFLSQQTCSIACTFNECQHCALVNQTRTFDGIREKVCDMNPSCTFVPADRARAEGCGADPNCVLPDQANLFGECRPEPAVCLRRFEACCGTQNRAVTLRALDGGVVDPELMNALNAAQRSPGDGLRGPSPGDNLRSQLLRSTNDPDNLMSGYMPPPQSACAWVSIGTKDQLMAVGGGSDTTLSIADLVQKCKVVTGCGNGVVEPGEQCDNGAGNNNDSAACTAECKDNVCRDGKVYVGVEACDDGNEVDTDGCTNACVRRPRPKTSCGDSVVDEGEECDDANISNNDGCSDVCEIERCGDGIRQTGLQRPEQCDDGNDVDTDGCSNTCTLSVSSDPGRVLHKCIRLIGVDEQQLYEDSLRASPGALNAQLLMTKAYAAETPGAFDAPTAENLARTDICQRFRPVEDRPLMQYLSVFLTTRAACINPCIAAQTLAYCVETEDNVAGDRAGAVRDANACTSAGLVSMQYKFRTQFEACTLNANRRMEGGDRISFLHCACEEKCLAGPNSDPFTCQQACTEQYMPGA